MASMDEFRQLALQQAVKDLFSKSYFSICKVREVSKLLRITPRGDIMDELQAFHCVDYADMNPRAKELLQSKVVEALRGETAFNPTQVLLQLTGEVKDTTVIEDRYIDAEEEGRWSNLLTFGKK